VFRAFDETLQRVVAVKALAPRLAVASPARKRFLREARSSAKVRHQNVVQVYAVEEQPLPYLVMEFIPGETLQQRLARMGPLETAEVVLLGRQIAEGLAAAPAIRRPRFRARWAAVAAVFLLMAVGGVGFTEATGVSDFRGAVIRLFSPEGTLVVEVDDPEVSVKIDGSDLVITGAGAKEILLKPGNYTVQGSKDGKVVSQELVIVTKNGRHFVRVSREAPSPEAKAAKAAADAADWERSVAAMPAAELEGTEPWLRRQHRAFGRERRGDGPEVPDGSCERHLTGARVDQIEFSRLFRQQPQRYSDRPVALARVASDELKVRRAAHIRPVAAERDAAKHSELRYDRGVGPVAAEGDAVDATRYRIYQRDRSVPAKGVAVGGYLVPPSRGRPT
jgi:hypothetical protein